MSIDLSMAEPLLTKRETARRRRNFGLLIFSYISLAISMSVSQYENIEPGSTRYWLLISIAVLIPAFDMRGLIKAMIGRAWPLLILAVIATAWWLLHGDPTAVRRLLLLVWVVAWVCSTNVVFNVRDTIGLYFFALTLGIIVLLFTDYNEFSLIPGRANPDLGSLRVSFFPNVANTGVLSLCLILVLTKDASTAWRYRYVFVVAMYFLIFSFVRAAFVAAVVYLFTRWLISRFASGSSKRMLRYSLLVTGGICLGIAFSASILFRMQDLPFVSSLFLRGESGIPVERIEYQLYRPWLWLQQWDLLWNSPYLMGWGSADFTTLVSGTQAAEEGKLISAGTESLPLRLLVEYGLPGCLFIWFLFNRLVTFANLKDEWACACFPALFTLIMTWGVFHPSDTIFVIFMIIMTKGSEGYVTGNSQVRSGDPRDLDLDTDSVAQ